MALGLKRREAEPDTASAAPISLEEASEQYAALLRQRAALDEGRRTWEERRVALRAAINATRHPPRAGQPRPAVRALLGEADAGEDVASLPQQLREAERQANDHADAMEVLRKRLEHERMVASGVVCEQIKPEYGRRVARLAEALIAAHRAHVDLVDLIDQLEREDVAWTSLHPLQPIAILGEARDRHSKLASWLMAAASAGYFDRAKTPKEFA